MLAHQFECVPCEACATVPYAMKKTYCGIESSRGEGALKLAIVLIPAGVVVAPYSLTGVFEFPRRRRHAMPEIRV